MTQSIPVGFSVIQAEALRIVIETYVHTFALKQVLEERSSNIPEPSPPDR